MGINATDSIQAGKSNEVELTKKQKKIAKKMEKARLQDEADTLIRSIAGHAQGKENKEVREYVLDELEKMYDDGKGSISKEKFEAAENAVKKGNIFQQLGRFFTGKQKNSVVTFEGQRNNNILEEHKKVIYSTTDMGQKTGLEILEVDKELGEKIAKSKLTADDIYQIASRYVGDEAEVSYSNKKRQPGEIQFILRELNQNEQGVVFSEEEAKQLYKAAGFQIEKSTDAAITGRDTALGAATGAATTVLPIVGFLGGKAVQNQHNQASDGQWQLNHQEAPYNDGLGLAAGITGTVVGGVTGFTLSRKIQKDRNEYKAIPTGIPNDVKTLADYKKFLESVASAKDGEGVGIGTKIAAYYTNEDGTLRKDQFIAQLKQSAGSVGMEDASVLNFKEANRLLTRLDSGTLKVEAPKAKEQAPVEEQEEEDCIAVVTTYDVTVDDTTKYAVKGGDNWDAIVRGIYNPQSEKDVATIRTQLKQAYLDSMQNNPDPEIRKKWKNVKVTDGFFPRVKDEQGKQVYLSLPNTAKAGNNEYAYKTDGKVVGMAPSKNYKGLSFLPETGTFASKRKEASFGACDAPLVKGLTPEEAAELAEKYKKQNEGKKNVVVVNL